MITRCPACKKEYDVLWPDLWAYKRRNHSAGSNYQYYCSWKCLRTLDQKGEEKHMGSRRLLTEEQKNHAVWLAISGEDPRPYLAECGSKNATAAWSAIRTAVKEKDPETYAKLPRNIGHKRRPNGREPIPVPRPIPGIKQPDTPTVETPETVTFNGKKYEKMQVETPEGEYSLADCFRGMNDAANEFFGKCEEMGLKLDKEPEVSEFNEEVADEEPAVEYVEAYKEDPVRPMQVVAIRSRVRPDCRWEVLADGDMVLCNGGFRFGLTAHQWKRFLEEVPEAMKQLGVEA